MKEFESIARAPNDLVPTGLEQRGETLPEERGVLSDQDPHGSLASTSVPPPGGLTSLRRPPALETRS